MRECFAPIDCPKDRPVCVNGTCDVRDGGGNDSGVDAGEDTSMTIDSSPGDSSSLMDSGSASDSDSDSGSATDSTVGTKAYLTKCASDGECASGHCTASGPRFCTKACTAHADCANGQICGGGLCALDDTGQTGCNLASGSPCQQYCYGSSSAAAARHCTHDCASGADCPAGYACSAVGSGKKVCVDIERSCATAGDCPSGLGYCGASGVGCTAKCESAADCPLRLVGLPAYTCEDKGLGFKVCVAPSDVLGADPIGTSCPATGTNTCRSDGCDTSLSPPQCVERCSVRGGCPVGWGCFPSEDPGPPATASLVCTRATGGGWLGDSCTKASDCATGLCQSPGYCTRLCVDGLCPDGMSCSAPLLTADDGTPIKLCTK